MGPTVLSSSEELKQLVDSVDTFLLDCDGVIYHGPNVVPGVKETLSMLRKAGQLLSDLVPCVTGLISPSTGKKLIFVTNNAAKSRRQYVETFNKLGLEAQPVCVSPSF